MSVHVLLGLLALSQINPGFLEQGFQSSTRTWGKPACGVRSSIWIERKRISNRGPFIVRLVVENVSDAPVNLETIAAFKIQPRDNVRGYWCPVSIPDANPVPNDGLALATRSRLMLEKGTSIEASMDLAKHAWEKTLSSIWPSRRFDAVVPGGKYMLRLEIEVVGNVNPQWICSNDVEVVIEP